MKREREIMAQVVDMVVVGALAVVAVIVAGIIYLIAR